MPSVSGSPKNLALMEPAFKRDALAYLFKDKIAAKSVIGDMPTDFFEEDAALDVVFTTFQEFVEKYNNRPREHEMIDALNDEADKVSMDKEAKKALFNAFQDIWDHEDYTAERVKQKLYDAITVHHMWLVAQQVPEFVDEGDFDGLVQAFSKARVTGSDSLPLVEYWRDTTDRAKRRKSRETNRISTGMDPLDDLITGGVPPGSLSMLVGSSGHGKSALLAQLAMAASLSGFKVGLITLELSQDQVMDRMDSHNSGIELDLLGLKKKKVVAGVADVVRDIKSTTGESPGDLYVQYYPTKSIGITQVEEYLQRLRDEVGVTLDILFVDYFGLMKMVGNYSNKWEALEENCEMLRGLAGKYDMAIWTADQTNRGGMGKDEVDMDDIAGSFGKVFPLDLMVNISQTKEEKSGSIISFRLYIAKNRLGPTNKQVWIKPDFARMRFEAFDEDAARKAGIYKPVGDSKKTGAKKGTLSASMMGPSA